MFVGAKLSDKKREQQIKGVLAHELCHYVMRLVYENQEKPYFKDRNDMKEMFKQIVRIIDQWSATKSRDPDDECNGIISTVFTLYSKEEFSLELIVRVVQILTEYGDDEKKTKGLQNKYQNLFNFWYNQVVPELQIYLHKNKNVKKLNGFFEFLPKIWKFKLKVNRNKEVEELIANKLSIVTTNIPNLLFVNICNILTENDGILMDSRNLFIESEKFNNLEFRKAFDQICRDVPELNIFVDCTIGFSKSIKNILFNKELNFIFIVSNESQCQELMDIFGNEKMKDAKKMEINYNWSDLTDESQKLLLLKTKINFQNNSKITLLDILKVKEPSGSDAVVNPKTDILLSMSEIVDDQLLNLMLEIKELSINSTKELDPNEKYFQILNQLRKYLKKEKGFDLQTDIDIDIDSDVEQGSNKIPKISQEELLSEVKNQKYVLISDIAGNGKSWAMKNFTKILRERNPTSWVTYVDLKQFIKEFKAQKNELEFSTFMAEKILNPDHQFESKLFQKMYKNGKVFILFDGFDEIPLDCAEFVSKLPQSFQSNEGNQLWIATRDYFEVDLKEKLQLDVSYGLEEMTDKDGIELIAKSWIFMDLNSSQEVMTVEKFNQIIDDSSNFKKYKEKAKQIVEKVKINWNNSVGMPQMFKMIADGFKYEKYLNNFTRSKIYLHFIVNLYKRWSDEEEQIRKEANNENQQLELNFNKIHQFHAVPSLFPNLVQVLFPGYDGSELPVEGTIACGIKNEETLREYLTTRLFIFAAETQMFLNNIINDCLELKQVQSQKLEDIKKCNTMKSFADYFTANLRTLEDFVLKYLKNRNCEEVKKLNLCFVKGKKENRNNFWTKIKKYFAVQNDSQNFKEFIKHHDERNKNILHHAARCENVELHETLWKLLLETFESREELKDFILQKDEHNNNFIHLLVVYNTADMIEFTIQKLKVHLSESDYHEILRSKGQFGRNLLQVAVICTKEVKTHQNLWKNLRDSCKSNEEFLEMLYENGQNILHLAIESSSSELFEFMIQELEKVASRFEIKKLLNEQNQNLLHLAAGWSKSLETHEILWKTYQKYFEPSEIYKFIKHIDTHGNNLLFTTVEKNTKEVVEFTWKKLKIFLIHNEQVEYLNNDDLLTVAFRNKRHPDVHDFIKNLLNSFEEMLKFENADLDADMEQRIEVSDIEEGNNELKLIEAAKENNPEKVKEIIKYVIDVNMHDENQITAIDYAWMNFINFKKYYERSSQAADEILLLLLNANSKFPSWRVGFDNKEASTGVHNFVDLCEGLHRAVVNGKVNHILQVLKEHPNLQYFHDRNNETLLLLTLKKQNFDILNILDGRVSIREDESLKEIYYEYFMGIEEELNFDEPKLPPVHILVLQAKSRIINSKDNNHFEYIANAFKSINEIESCSKILKIAALLKDFKMIFDFSSSAFNDTHYDSGNIYIGAKELINVKGRNNVIGTLIHELCHLAMLLTYMNNFNPYPEGKSEEYEIIFNKIKQNHIKNQKLDDIVVQTFAHKEEKQHAELIVRPLQILVHYRENAAKINQLQEKYSALFDYVRDIVIPDIQKAIAVYKNLQHENRGIMFEDLTAPMKAKILNSKMIFQGEKSTFSDLFGNNEKTMNSLSSEDIRRLLFKNECLIIGTDLKFDTSHCNVDRKFIQFGNASEILAGTGKTTSMKDFVMTLKKTNKSSWVSMIKLKDVHDDFHTVKNNRNIVNVKKILLKILKINSITEVNLFLNLYESDKVIIILDGFDEITPEYSKQLLIVFKEMNEKSRNQIWISTKIHNDQQGYKFSPITKDEKIISIGNLAEASSGSDGIGCINDSCNLKFHCEHEEHRITQKRKFSKNEKLKRTFKY